MERMLIFYQSEGQAPNSAYFRFRVQGDRRRGDISLEYNNNPCGWWHFKARDDTEYIQYIDLLKGNEGNT